MGMLMFIFDVTEDDVSIAHRPSRPIFNGHNERQKFLNAKSQERAGYDTHTDWPIINIFPGHFLSNPALEFSREGFNEYCKSFTALPDF